MSSFHYLRDGAKICREKRKLTLSVSNSLRIAYCGKNGIHPIRWRNIIHHPIIHGTNPTNIKFELYRTSQDAGMKGGLTRKKRGGHRSNIFRWIICHFDHTTNLIFLDGNHWCGLA